MYANEQINQIYSRFASASSDWLNSPDGIKLMQKSIDLVRSKYGECEANFLRNQLDILKILSKVGVC